MIIVTKCDALLSNRVTCHCESVFTSVDVSLTPRDKKAAQKRKKPLKSGAFLLEGGGDGGN